MIIAVEEYETIPILYSENDSGIIKWDKKKEQKSTVSKLKKDFVQTASCKTKCKFQLYSFQYCEVHL